jgi:ethanolamine utilization protein EutN
MFLARVRGTVVSTQKDERLTGFKLLITQRIDVQGNFIDKPGVSVDTVGAGNGETVLVTQGSSARYAAMHDGQATNVVDSTIVGIVDYTEIDN